MGAEGAAPAEEGGAGEAVVDELGGGDQVHEPGEDGGGAVGDLQEGEEGDGENGEDGVNWDAVAGCSVDVLVRGFPNGHECGGLAWSGSWALCLLVRDQIVTAMHSRRNCCPPRTPKPTLER